MSSSLDDAANAALDNAIAAIGNHYFDVTIICTTDDHQARFWMNLLETDILKERKVLAVSEDWNNSGGAGNGLGTLYAWKKACALANEKYEGSDIETDLTTGKISAAIYHTAGKGTRLAPLPASENNNKPGVVRATGSLKRFALQFDFSLQPNFVLRLLTFFVNAPSISFQMKKLPFPLTTSEGSIRPLSVLESVIRQTGIYARPGRLSVFWGDQVFIPTAPYQVEPKHHIDILCTLLGESAPTAAEWSEQGLDKYGVIVVLGNGEAAQVEKVTHETAIKMLSSLGTTISQVGPSLGSFSVSAVFLKILMETFTEELVDKTAKLDTDPHFWMPLTLPKGAYVDLMKEKGTTESESTSHYDRMQAMKHKFLTDSSTSGYGLFGAVNVGKGACWWDYGQLKLYATNCSLLLEKDSESANLLRRFLGIENMSRLIQSRISSDSAIVDDTSYVIGSILGSGSAVEKSLLANVAAQAVVCEGSIIVNCVAKKITAGKESILYNIIATDENEEITIGPGEVIVGVMTTDGEYFRLRSRIDIDGGKAWKVVLNDGSAVNRLSFEQVHANNANANIVEIAKKRKEMFEAMVLKLGL